MKSKTNKQTNKNQPNKQTKKPPHPTLNSRSFASKNVQNIIQAPTVTQAHTHFHWIGKAAVSFLAFSGTVGMDPKNTATPGYRWDGYRAIATLCPLWSNESKHSCSVQLIQQMLKGKQYR